ncbi:hypothetical protein ABI_22070 [Asticcacaulis biprosthecium C19]|uniref:Uncharacterized protein n=1 Tax=Asticcacaulis biprosthecium C19 TaxID=715226 RepID=F4QH12_9CAUL|nr:hypothetical protein [Asticcacaulis biprosthecium]EGF93765.1 hypothetical protein ABI_22070 [Asticcacaulis biprosthecium C19]
MSWRETVQNIDVDTGMSAGQIPLFHRPAFLLLAFPFSDKNVHGNNTLTTFRRNEETDLVRRHRRGVQIESRNGGPGRMTIELHFVNGQDGISALDKAVQACREAGGGVIQLTGTFDYAYTFTNLRDTAVDAIGAIVILPPGVKWLSTDDTVIGCYFDLTLTDYHSPQGSSLRVDTSAKAS